MWSPLWKITHQKPSVLCTPPFENHCFLVGVYFGKYGVQKCYYTELSAARLTTQALLSAFGGLSLILCFTAAGFWSVTRAGYGCNIFMMFITTHIKEILFSVIKYALFNMRMDCFSNANMPVMEGIGLKFRFNCSLTISFKYTCVRGCFLHLNIKSSVFIRWQGDRQLRCAFMEVQLNPDQIATGRRSCGSSSPEFSRPQVAVALCVAKPLSTI